MNIKRKNLAACFLFFLITKTGIAIDFLAYGNLYHQLEPCGCDPLTDRGGIRRLSSLIAKVRAKNKEVITFDLGNNFSPKLIKESDTFYLKKH